MTAKSDFTPQEWDTLSNGPASAGVIVASAQRGGMIRETLAIGKAYVEAREQHGASELLDEIVAAGPKVDRLHYGAPDELKEQGLQLLRDAVELLDRKATLHELVDYRRFVLSVAGKVADAHRERVKGVDDAEQAAFLEIAKTMGTLDELAYGL